MYYVYKKMRGTVLPNFNYIFNKFSDFYPIANVLTAPVIGEYNICVKSDVYKDILEFIKMSGNYAGIKVWIEVSASTYDYIMLYNPTVSFLGSESSYDMYKRLVKKYNLLFDSDSIKVLYYNTPHTYEDLDEALQLIKQTYPNAGIITTDLIRQLFIIDDAVYPYQVLTMFLLMKRWRWARFEKCYERFGNDLMYYSVRKQARKICNNKLTYLKTGNGQDFIKKIPILNVIRLLNIFDYSENKLRDIRTVFCMYEKGAILDDTMEKRTVGLYY